MNLKAILLKFEFCWQ